MSNEPNPLSSGQEPSQRRFLRHAFERAQAGLKAAWDAAVSSPEFYRTALVTAAHGTLGLAATALGAPLVAVVGTQAVLGLVDAIRACSDGVAASAALAAASAAVAAASAAVAAASAAVAAASAAVAGGGCPVAVGPATVGALVFFISTVLSAIDAERARGQNPALAAAGAGLGCLVGSLAMAWAGYAYAPDSLKEAPAAKAPVVSSTFSIDAKGPA